MNSPLRKARKARGLTLEDVAAKVGTDTGNLSRIERGQQASKDMVDKLVKFFDGQVTELQIIYPERFANDDDTAGNQTNNGSEK